MAEAQHAIPLRAATQADIPVLVRHRRLMFEEMAVMAGGAPDPRALDAMDAAYARHAQHHLGAGTLLAWVAEDSGRVVASGAVSIYPLPPRPDNLTERSALLHSVYTEPGYRRRGLARRIVKAAILACRENGLPILSLHASDAGKALYESLGFELTSEMGLHIS